MKYGMTEKTDLTRRLCGIAKRLKEVSDVVNDDEADISVIKEALVRTISEVDYVIKILHKHMTTGEV